MNTELIAQEKAITNVFSKKKVSAIVFKKNLQILEDMLKGIPGVTLRNDPKTPLKHTILEDLYAREITIPAGYVLTTGIHKTRHIAIISQGSCIVATADGIKEYTAPCQIVTEIGTKRAIYVREELVWTTIHAINVKTPEEAIKAIEFVGGTD